MNGTPQYKQQRYQDHKRTEIQDDFCFYFSHIIVIIISFSHQIHLFASLFVLYVFLG